MLVSHWQQRYQQLYQWYQTHAAVYLNSDELGSSLSECLELLKQHTQFQTEAQEWSVAVDSLIARASDIQLQGNPLTPAPPPSEESRRLAELKESVWVRMEARQRHLEDSQDFYTSADQACAVFSDIDRQMKTLRCQSWCWSAVSQRLTELQKTITQTVTQPVHRGHTLLNNTSLHSVQAAGVQRMLGNLAERADALSRECHAHIALANQKQELVSSCENLLEKVSSWLKCVDSVLIDSSEPGEHLSDGERILNKHLDMYTEAQAAVRDTDTMKQILDQIKVLDGHHTPERTNHVTTQLPNNNTQLHNSTETQQASGAASPQPSSKTSRTSTTLSSIKALTQRLKTPSKGQNTTSTSSHGGSGCASSSVGESSALWSRVCVVGEEVRSVMTKISGHLDVLRPYTHFLGTAQQVEQEMLSRMERGVTSAPSQTGPVDDCHTALLSVQHLADDYINTVGAVSDGVVFNVRTTVSVVQRTVERLVRTQQKLSELNQNAAAEKQWNQYQQQYHKTLHGLLSVEDLLVESSKADLGSDLHTVNKLLDNFNQTKRQLPLMDVDVETMLKASQLLVVKEERGGEQREVQVKEQVAEVLRLQQSVKERSEACEAVLAAAHSFHAALNQLEALLRSEPVKIHPGQHPDTKTHVQTLYKTTAHLGKNLCNAVQNSVCVAFVVSTVEERLVRADRELNRWLCELRQHEDRLQKQTQYNQMTDSLTQLNESFKEMKKRFNNLRFSFLKRNDRGRNIKAVRNQLQQTQMYTDKIQGLKKRMQGVTARLASGVKEGFVTRETEDAVNELQRQMGEFERNVEEHTLTLDLTCRLQQAVEEYQFWCEEARATIVRVGKYSSECRTREAVAVLYKQFEKFVWPTVPQQEERITQITELAVRLHGAEEGQRYIEKTVSKHQEIIESIRELSTDLLKLEDKLQLDAAKQQNAEDESDKDGENPGEKEEEKNEPKRQKKEIEEERETERKRENTKREQEVERQLKEERDMEEKKGDDEPDNRETQEELDLVELKETGHTPELTTEHDGKEVPVKKLMPAANQKAALHKSRGQVQADRHTGSDRQTVISESSPPSSSKQGSSSFSSSHAISLSVSPSGHTHRRRVHALLSQPQPPVAPASSVIGLSFSDIQREFGSKETPSAYFRTTHTKDTSAGRGLSEEAALQQQEVMTDESLSNDEYECGSPDDMSLPSLSVTPESNFVQSDVDDSPVHHSHSAQYACQSEPCGSSITMGLVQSQSQNSGSGTGEGVSSLTERFRFTSTLQSPLTISAPTLVSSTLVSTVLQSKETKTVSVSSYAGSFPGCRPEPCLLPGPSPEHISNTVLQDSGLSQGVPGGHLPSVISETSVHSQSRVFSESPPPQRAVQQHSTLQNDSSSTRTDIHPQTSCLSQARNLPPDTPHQSSGGLLHNRDLHTSSTGPQTSCSPRDATVPEDTGHPADSTVTKDSGASTPDSSALPQTGPASGSIFSPGQSADPPQHRSIFSQPSQGRSIRIVQGVSTSSAVPQQNVSHCHTSPSGASVPQRGFPVPKESSHSPQGSRGLEGQVVSTEVSSVCSSSISISSSAISSTQTFYALHESLASSSSTHTRGRVHDASVSRLPQCEPPTAAPVTQAQTADAPLPHGHAQRQASAEQANPHVAPPPPPHPHLLTPEQDPSLCWPTAIREGITRTPQIQGPSIPPPSSAPSPGSPPRITRPLSSATVMEGSPVTLEVEVTARPEPTLTWLTDGKVLTSSAVGATLASTDHTCARSVPAASDLHHGLYQAVASSSDQHGFLCSATALQATACHCSADDSWLLVDIYDIIRKDWHTWFGTFCTVLWLLYLVLL